MSSTHATNSTPEKAKLAPTRSKPRGSSYDADELNEIRNLSLGDDEGGGPGSISGRRGRRGSGGGGGGSSGGGGGRKFDKGRQIAPLFIF